MAANIAGHARWSSRAPASRRCTAHRRALAAVAGAALFALATVGVAEENAGSVTVEVQHNGDSYVATATVLAPAPVAAAWAVMTDFDHMATFMPSLTSSKVLKRVDNSVLVQQSGRMELGGFKMPWDSVREMNLAPPTIRSKQLRGNMQRVESTTTFSDVPTGTRIDYRVEMVPKLWMPENVLAPMLKSEIEHTFTAVLQEIARRKTP